MKKWFFQFRRSGSQQLLVAVVLLVCISGVVHAATEAGTIIKNQASASYRDSFGVKRIATSNLVETVVRQVAAVELTRDQQKPAVAGREIYFTHIVRNTGNGTDRYDLEATSVGGGTIQFDSVTIYSDNNRDGQPDSFNPIDSTVLLPAGESQSVVIAALVPSGSVAGSNGSMTIRATSRFDSSVTMQNIDSVSITESAVVEVTKRISALKSSSPGGPFTVSITYKNNSSQTASELAIIDALPPGMSYVPWSGRWSGSGSVVLSDNNPNDSHAGVNSSVRYCAYDVSCIGVPEASSDTDTLTINQVTAVVASVAPGQSGEVQFQVTIDSGLEPSVLLNVAEIQYNAGMGAVYVTDSNTVPFQVTQGTSVVINGSDSSNVDGVNEPLELMSPTLSDLQAGNNLFFKNVVWNNGNGVDTFDISIAGSTFPAGTVFRLLQVDAQTPLLDTSGNGLSDTGPVAAGDSYEVVIHVILPDGTYGAASNYEVSTVATSVVDADINNDIANRLISITPGGVDITNTSELGRAEVTGVGVGPEAEPVTNRSVSPGSTGSIDLYINNTSDYPMDFDLAFSVHSDFSSIEVPANWLFEFQNDSGEVVSNTGVIAANDFLKITVLVRVPSEALPQDINIYFRAQNDRYGVSDIKHDQFTVQPEPSLLLGINQEGQVSPGGSHVYTHSLLNSGNTDVSNISLSVSDSRAAQGWTSLIYEDTDGNGSISSGDQIIDTVDLTPGQSMTLFVKVFAPANAPVTGFNSTVLRATSDAITHTVTDITKVSTGEISVMKEQAVDNGCDGVLDTPYGNSILAVEPGNNCVRYRLTAINGGSASVVNVVVADGTPTFTSYIDSASCSKSSCTISEPVPGGEGEVVASLPELIAGDSVVVEFAVRID